MLHNKLNSVSKSQIDNYLSNNFGKNADDVFSQLDKEKITVASQFSLSSGLKTNDYELYSPIVIRLPVVLEPTGLSKASVYEKLNPKSKLYDPTFPQQIEIGVRARAWRRHEILAWLQSKADARVNSKSNVNSNF